MRSASSSTEMPLSSSIQSCVLVAISSVLLGGIRLGVLGSASAETSACLSSSSVGSPPAQLCPPPRPPRRGLRARLLGWRLGSGVLRRLLGGLGLGRGVLRGGSSAARPRPRPPPRRGLAAGASPRPRRASAGAAAAGASPAGISPDSFFCCTWPSADGEAAEQRVQRAHEAADRARRRCRRAGRRALRARAGARASGSARLELLAAHHAALEGQQLGRSGVVGDRLGRRRDVAAHERQRGRADEVAPSASRRRPGRRRVR